MADVITRFKLETTQFDSKLRDTAKALQDIAHQASLGGKDFNNFNQKAIESARALGTVQSGVNNTKDKLRDLVGSYNDAAKAYNSLTETAKKGEFGQAMSQSLTQLQQRIRETKEELYGLGDGMKGASGGSLFSSDKLSGMLQVFGGNLMTKGAGMALSFAGEIKDMVAQGIELAKAGEGVRLAFQRLGRGDILDGLREATHGTVTDLELMKAAVKFNDFKLPLDELGTMLAFAQQKAKDTGQSVDYMVDSIVTGLGRKSLMILDNLGLSASEVKEKMAETGDMTKAVGAIIREQMAKAGDYVETAADRATQANVSLQNKMEELGRKFLPVKQASNDLWTSIKIGILDIVGGPLADLLNGLTRAGQLRNELKNIGSDERVNTDVEKLKGSNYKPQAYQMMLAKYSREEQKALDNYKKAQKGGMGSIAVWENRYLARKSMREDFQSRGREVVNGANQKNTPTTPTTTTTPTGGSTTTTTTTHQTPQQRAQESFTKAEQNYKQALEKAAMELQAGAINMAQFKQQEMQAAEQRWKAIGDARNINDSDRLRQAQDEAAAEYKRLTAEVKTATERQKAIDKATRDLENANQKLATARTEMATAKQQGDLQAYNTAKDKATAAQKEVTRLENVKVNVETGKVDLPDIPKVIEQTINTKVGEVITPEVAAEVVQTINTRLGRIVTPDILESITQTINTKIGRVITPEIAKEVTQVVDVETGTVNLPDIPTEMTTTVDFQASTRNIDAAISYVKKEMDTIPVGTIEFNLDQTKLVDLTTLKTLITEQMKNGLQIDPNFAQSMFGNILAGKDIENTTWQAQVDNINKNRTANGLNPLKIDYKTGEKENKQNKKDKEKDLSVYQDVSRIASSVQGMLSTLEQLGVKIPDELKGIMSGVQSIIEFMSATSSFISAVAGIKMFGFANGGMIKAYSGTLVGNTYSGDQLRGIDNHGQLYGLNAGEVVLNRAQTGNIASQLSGTNGGGQNAQPYVTGDIIFLGLQNYLQENGYGKLMTTNMR